MEGEEFRRRCRQSDKLNPDAPQLNLALEAPPTLRVESTVVHFEALFLAYPALNL